jgi:hypothetical protein
MTPLDFYGVLEFAWELIPADWGLGSGKVPEKWVFTVGNDAVIIGAQPLGYYHNKFPFQVLEYEIVRLWNVQALDARATQAP